LYMFFALVTDNSSAFLSSTCYGDNGDLPSFPTRRSSDLQVGLELARGSAVEARVVRGDAQRAVTVTVTVTRPVAVTGPVAGVARSEEHTSELQSREKLVCRLLLEKKNKETAATELMGLKA